MSFRYIGSKARLIEQIKEHIGPASGGFFVDAFCGTGAVAEAAADLGWPIRINDHLPSAVISASARLASIEQAQFNKLGGYASAVARLNSARPRKGYIWRTYSPSSLPFCGIERRYFTEVNAAQIDAMRAQIRDWKESDLLNGTEEQVLIADLFGAINRIANIAGTFGCFLSKWTPQAKEHIEIRPRSLRPSTVHFEATVGDVFDVKSNPGDLVYLDPPYTKRQYASYYHILETVALGDEPNVEGVAGLRPWKDRASDFCYKTRALPTLSRLVQLLESERVLLSYSSEGHISMVELEKELSLIGHSRLYPLGAIARYRPNKVASGKASSVNEYLAVITRRARRKKAAPNKGEASVA